MLLRTSSAVFASHQFTGVSTPPVATIAPSGRTATASTSWSVPLNVSRPLPVFASTSRLVRSLLAVAYQAPSGEKATA